jgi:hypothetical protein
MLDQSIPLWQFASHFVTIDYPTMFLMPAVFLSSFIASLVLSRIPKWRYGVGAVLILLAGANNRNYLRVNEYVNPSVSEIVTSEITTNSFNEYLPLTANAALMVNNSLPDVQNIAVENLRVTKTATLFVVSFNNKIKGEATFKIFGFPGLVSIMDGAEIPYLISETGQIKIPVEAGEHTVQIFYRPNF